MNDEAVPASYVFETLLSVAARFDNRPGRLYSFVGHRAQP